MRRSQQTLQGAWAKPRGPLKHWDPLLKEWTRVVSKYCRTVVDDVPYHHKERPILSLLAGAAWRSNWISLEEFSIGKRGLRRRGRADLWFQSPCGTEYLEAKFTWQDCRETFVRWSLRTLYDAVMDARRVIPDERGARRMGIAFICAQTYGRTADDQVRCAIEALRAKRTDHRIDAMAWSFPPAARRFTGGSGKTQYSGVALLAKAVG